MYKRRNQNWIKHLDFIVLDVVVLLLSFFAAYYLYNHTLRLVGTLYRNLLLLLILLDVLVSVLFNTMHNVLHRGYFQEFVQTLKQVVLVYAFELLILFLMKWSGSYSRIILSLTVCFHLVLGYLTRLAWKHVLIRRGVQAEKRNMLLVCREADVESILARSRPVDEAEFSGLVLTDRDAVGSFVQGLPVVATLEDAGQYICREWVDEVFIYADLVSLDEGRCHAEDEDPISLFSEDGAKPKSPSVQPEPEPGTVAALIDQCRQMAVAIHIRIPLGGYEGKSFVEKVNGFNVVTITSNYASPLQLLIKRAIDIIGGLVGSLLALIIMLFVGPKIKKLSPGPIIFKQERIGQNGKRFQVFKIRSMYMDADERKKEFMAQNRVSDGMMFKLDFDPRIIGNEILPDGTKKTGIGEFIRSHSLDEFPQFWNVLRGEMSVVGTRPPTVDEWEKYQFHHRARLAFKPGVTGMWQVNGRSNITDFEEVVRLDTEYIEHWDIGLDIKLILKTIKNIFTKEGAM